MLSYPFAITTPNLAQPHTNPELPRELTRNPHAVFSFSVALHLRKCLEEVRHGYRDCQQGTSRYVFFLRVIFFPTLLLFVTFHFAVKPKSTPFQHIICILESGICAVRPLQLPDGFSRVTDFPPFPFSTREPILPDPFVIFTPACRGSLCSISPVDRWSEISLRNRYPRALFFS